MICLDPKKFTLFYSHLKKKDKYLRNENRYIGASTYQNGHLKMVIQNKIVRNRFKYVFHKKERRRAERREGGRIESDR